MTTSGLFEQIKPAFGSLLKEHAFDKIEDRYEPEHFGNAVLTFASPDFALRFIRDRGQVLVAIGRSETKAWHRLDSTIEFVTGEPVCVGELPPLDRLAEAVKSNYENLTFMFEEQRYATTTKRMLDNFVDSQTVAWIKRMPKL